MMVIFRTGSKIFYFDGFITTSGSTLVASSSSTAPSTENKKSLPLSNRSVAGTKKQAYKILRHRSNQQSENKVKKDFW